MLFPTRHSCHDFKISRRHRRKKPHSTRFFETLRAVLIHSLINELIQINSRPMILRRCFLHCVYWNTCFRREWRNKKLSKIIRNALSDALLVSRFKDFAASAAKCPVFIWYQIDTGESRVATPGQNKSGSLWNDSNHLALNYIHIHIYIYMTSINYIYTRTQIWTCIQHVHRNKFLTTEVQSLYCWADWYCKQSSFKKTKELVSNICHGNPQVRNDSAVLVVKKGDVPPVVTRLDWGLRWGLRPSDVTT